MNAMNKKYIASIRDAVIARMAVTGTRQAELARRCGLTQAGMSNRLRHFDRMSLRDLVTTCDELGIDLLEIGSRR